MRLPQSTAADAHPPVHAAQGPECIQEASRAGLQSTQCTEAIKHRTYSVIQHPFFITFCTQYEIRTFKRLLQVRFDLRAFCQLFTSCWVADEAERQDGQRLPRVHPAQHARRHLHEAQAGFVRTLDEPSNQLISPIQESLEQRGLLST